MNALVKKRRSAGLFHYYEEEEDKEEDEDLLSGCVVMRNTHQNLNRNAREL
jgi:hypothetical protein